MLWQSQYNLVFENPLSNHEDTGNYICKNNNVWELTWVNAELLQKEVDNCVASQLLRMLLNVCGVSGGSTTSTLR